MEMLSTMEFGVRPVFVPSTTGAPPLLSDDVLKPKICSVVYPVLALASSLNWMTKLTTSLYVAVLMSDEFDSRLVQCAALSEKKAAYAAVAPCFFAASHSLLVEV